MWTVLLVACGGSVTLEGVDGFGVPMSAWWGEYGTVEHLIVLGEGVEDYGPAAFDASVRVSTRLDGCAAEQRYLEGWNDITAPLLDALGESQEAACAAVPEFLAQRAGLSAEVFGANEVNSLNFGYCGEANDGCTLDEGEFDLAGGDDYGMWATLRRGAPPEDPEEAAAWWSVEDCDWVGTGPDDEEGDFGITGGTATFSDLERGVAVTIDVDADLVDIDDYEEGVDDPEVEGAVTAHARAEWCEVGAIEAVAF